MHFFIPRWNSDLTTNKGGKHLDLIIERFMRVSYSSARDSASADDIISVL
jgi:hypothetical protein